MTTPEERADHIYDVSVWQYVHTESDSAYKSIIIEHIAAEIRAAVADALRWIPVSVRVPDDDDVRVLVRDRSRTIIAHANMFGFYIYDDNDTDVHRINATHWQPLPPPPTKEQPQ